MIQEDIRKELQGEISESSDEYEEEEEEVVFTKSNCKCDLCEMINTIEDKWKDWVPQTPLEKSIKKNIDEIPLVQQ